MIPHASAHSGETADANKNLLTRLPNEEKKVLKTRTDGALRSRVDEGLDLVAIDFHIDCTRPKRSSQPEVVHAQGGQGNEDVL